MADVSILNGYNIKDATARSEVATKITNPSSKSNGQILKWNGTAWVAADAPATGVTSWNGQTGAVTYTAPVTSVNGETGAVSLDASDVGARPSTWTPSASDVGAIANPSSKSNGQVLTYNGSAWVAQNASGGMTGTTFTATIPYSSWTTSGDYKTKTVTVSGLKATYPVAPVVDCSLSGTDGDADNAILEAFGSLAIIDTAANSITVKAIGTAPTVNIPIIISVWE